jgi:hypothetical protein
LFTKNVAALDDKIMKKILLFASILLSLLGKAQTIKLKNPSFEYVDNIDPRLMYRDKVTGVMKDTILLTSDSVRSTIKQEIIDWQNCGSLGESPPDIHPTNLFGVTWAANHGKYYLGMVTRDNGTWESAGQKLTTPLKADTCYELTVWLMCSPTYQSRSRQTGQPVNYDKPTRLRIWGGNNICDEQELLVTSNPIQNRAWFPYSFVFKPKKKIKSIRIEAFYTEGSAFYNGNLLLDNLSDITPCSCSKMKKE